MATQNCPKCKNDSFTWRMDDDISSETIWCCTNCNYEAFEKESKEIKCNSCSNTKIELKDNRRIYWWCFDCNKEIV